MNANESLHTSFPTEVADFLDRPKRLLIGKGRQDGGRDTALRIGNPADGTLLTEVPVAGPADVEEAVSHAQKALRRWSALSPAMRASYLFRLADLLEKHAAEFAAIESIDVGKPLMVTRMLDVPFTAEVIRYNAGWATKLCGETFDPRQISSAHGR